VDESNNLLLEEREACLLLMFFAFMHFVLAEKNEFRIVQPIHGHDDDNMVNVFVMSMPTIV